MTNPGQILPESEFGKLLTKLAKESEVTCEIGTWFGNGSTLCLYRGMTRPEQRLVTFEVDLTKVMIARNFLKNDPRIEFVHGTIVRSDEFQPFEHPDPKAERFYWPEFSATANAPYRFDAVPEKIDLLVLDGGDWCSEVEFEKLIDRTKVLAMDDTNPSKTPKNSRNRETVLSQPEAWEVVADNQNDRNGYTVARRKG